MVSKIPPHNQEEEERRFLFALRGGAKGRGQDLENLSVGNFESNIMDRRRTDTECSLRCLQGLISEEGRGKEWEEKNEEGGEGRSKPSSRTIFAS